MMVMMIDHDHDDFDSFSITLGNIDDADEFENKLKSVIEKYDILRIKGFLHRPNIQRREVLHSTGSRINRYFDRPWHPDEEKLTKLIIIGFKGLNQQTITTELSGK